MRTPGNKKITVGFVIQTFVQDGNDNKCIRQEFVAGDQVDWEDEDGNSIDPWSEYQSFEMVQPNAPDAIRSRLAASIEEAVLRRDDEVRKKRGKRLATEGEM